MKQPGYLILIAVSAFICGCNKEVIVKKTETEITVIRKPTAISIAIDKIVNDSTLTLKWSKINHPGFKEYILKQSTRVLKGGVFDYVNTQTVIKNADSTSYTVNNIPRIPDASFTITASYTQNAKIEYISANLTYSRKDAYLNTKVSHALIDKQAKVIFLFDNAAGTINSYDYGADKPLKQLSLGIGLGYAAMGVIDSKTEIYAPTVDGWLFIIDAATLTVTDKIFVGGENIASAAVFGDKIAVSATDRSQTYSYENNVKIYDRKTKKLIGRTAYYDTTRLLNLEGSSEFIDITFNIGPTQLTYFKLDNDGKPIVKFEDKYHGDHNLDPTILRSFPDGKKFITGSHGTVYTSDLTFESDLNYYGTNYSDFAFNQLGSIIYCSELLNKSVTAISYPAKTAIKSYVTKLQPLKIFRDDDSLICVSTENTYGYKAVIFIEKIKL